MSWETTAPALLARLDGVEGIGIAYLGDLHVRDASRAYALFGHAIDNDERTAIRGARLIRDSVFERFDNTLSNEAEERYIVRVLAAVTERSDSEAEFQALLDRILARLRGVTTLGSAFLVNAGRLGDVVYTEFKGDGAVLCHYAEIAIDVLERYTFTTVAQPVASAATHTARSVFADVVEQIAGYLELAESGWKIHRGRPAADDETDRKDLFEVPLEDDPERTAVRAWWIYQGSDAEERGLGPRVEARTSWQLGGYLAWHDESGTYDRFQRYLDAVRAIFRGVQNLGRVENPTCAVSLPLRFTVGEAKLMGVICHSVEAELAIEEVVSLERIATEEFMGLVVLTGTGTYTPTTGTRRIVFELIGGGGGGGGITYTSGTVGAAGGGAGGYLLSSAVVAGSGTYSVGAGGAGGANTGAAGAAGGNTTFTYAGTVYTASGGGGGGGLSAAPLSALGGAGGTSSNGQVNGAGGPGEPNSSGRSGAGGLGRAGGGGPASFTLGTGAAGSGYGGGGAGGVQTFPTPAVGGAGAAGTIVIWEYSVV